MNDSNKQKFIWWRDIPIWFTAGAAVIGVWIAWTTLDPLLEKHRLQRELIDLKGEKERLIDEVKSATSQRDQLQTSNKALKEEVERSQQSVDKILGSLETVSKNINEQIKRERQLSEENRKIVTDNERLRKQTEILEVERQRLEEERVSNVARNRRYILDVLKSQVVAQTLVRSGYWRFLGIDPFATDLTKGFVIHTEKSDTSKNGRDLVSDNFDTPVFKLLANRDQKQLKEDILGFMDNPKNSAIFTVPLFTSFTSMEKFELLQAMKESDKVSDNKTLTDSKAKSEIRARLKEIQAEEKRVDDAREAFHKALDRMISSLAPKT